MFIVSERSGDKYVAKKREEQRFRDGLIDGGKRAIHYNQYGYGDSHGDRAIQPWIGCNLNMTMSAHVSDVISVDGSGEVETVWNWNQCHHKANGQQK